MSMCISIHVGVKMIQQKKVTTHPLSKHVQNMLGKRFEDKPRMDNGNENQENATRKGMKIVVRRLQKYRK